MEDRMIGTTGAWRRVQTLMPTVGLLAGLVGVTGITACDDDDDFVNVIPVTPVVTTFNDPNFNFATLRTFSMPDTVVHFNPLTGTPLEVSRQFDQTALDQVRQDLLSRGYVEISNPATVRPDFVVLVGATATQNYNAWVSYPWYGTWGFYNGWGWYAPGFDTSWGIVYPWGGAVGVTAYDRGTLVVTIIPTLQVNPQAKNVTAVWAGVATSVLAGQVTAGGVSAAINRMFDLSPYLVAGPAPAAR
jgi:hypothetical protein